MKIKNFILVLLMVFSVSAAYASSAENESINGITTTSGVTTATVATMTLTDGDAGYADAQIVVRNTANGDTSIMEILAPVKRPAGSGASVVSLATSLSLTGNASLIGATATIDASGNDIRVRVTGVLFTNIEWLVRLSVLDLHQ